MSSRTALGIEISAQAISLALVKQNRQEMTLVKAVWAAMPEGAVSGGNIKNPQLVAKTIKELCNKNKIPAKNIAVSLYARPSLARIVELPKELSVNPAQYVRDELKHYAMLAGKSVSQDFCALPGKAGKNSRVLLSAAEEDKVTGLAVAMNRMGMSVKAIELNAFAAARAVYPGLIAKKFGANLLLVHSQDFLTTIFVFRDTRIDFIRCVNITRQELESVEGKESLKSEIDSIRQFYELEVEAAAKKWELVLLGFDAETDKLPEFEGDVTACSAGSFEKDTGIVSGGTAASFGAAGLAMKLLAPGLGDMKTNLMPARTDEIHKLQKFGLCAAIVMIAAFMAVMGSVPLLARQVASAAATAKKQVAQAAALSTLLSKQTTMLAEIKKSSQQLAQMEQVVKKIQTANWSGLLTDIGKRTPGRVRIVSVITKENNSLIINGESLSNEDVHTFVKMLSSSPLVKNANLLRAEAPAGSAGLITYSITCNLNTGTFYASSN